MPAVGKAARNTNCPDCIQAVGILNALAFQCFFVKNSRLRWSRHHGMRFMVSSSGAEYFSG